MLNYTVEQPERLDKFLAHASGKSRGLVQKAIKVGQVKVQNKVAIETDHPLKVGDVVECPEFKEFELRPTDIDLKIVYENDDLVVIDKPAGLVVHPGAGNTEDTLSHALVARYPDIKSVGEKFRPGIVHRLDEDTSGLLIIAKNQTAYDYLKELFLEHKVQKQYLALVHGVPQNLHGIIDEPLEKNFKRQKMSVVDRSASGGKVSRGKEAITEYSVLAQGQHPKLDQVALFKVNLHTGRTHQIRAHLAHINHPIVGDQTYGSTFKKNDLEVLQRQFLHAFNLKFQLFDKTWIELESPLPPDLQKILSDSQITFKIT